MLSKAKRLAELAHKDQKYGDDMPYTKHLKDVVLTLVRFGHKSIELRTAAWLHDIVEDTVVTIDTIENEFGRKVSSLVWAVTNEGGKNRAERHLKTYPKIKRTPGAIILKLADRIANVTQCIKDDDDMLGMYRKEHKGFRDALYTPGQVEEPMWECLDNLLGDKDELPL